MMKKSIFSYIIRCWFCHSK